MLKSSEERRSRLSPDVPTVRGGLVKMHDFGGIARVREVDGVEQRGFEFYVGGGLGAVPHQAELFDEFLPEEELLPICQSISRVFARLGKKMFGPALA